MFMLNPLRPVILQVGVVDATELPPPLLIGLRRWFLIQGFAPVGCSLQIFLGSKACLKFNKANALKKSKVH
mgnify:CR=1 FL=1